MRWKIVHSFLILICFVIGVALWPDNSSKQTLPDGTVLILSGLQIGRTNVSTHGTWLSKTLGRLAPAKGVTVAGFKLQRPSKITFSGPEGSEVLSAQIQLLPGSPRENSFVSPPFYRKFRLLIFGDDDFTFLREFDGFKKQTDGLFSYVRAWSFPRDSRLLHFRLEERDNWDSGDWREVTTFVLKNPQAPRIESWRPAHFPRFALAGSLDVEVGELTVQHKPINPTDIWTSMALLPVRVRNNGQVVTNWGIRDGRIWDASGNFDYFTFSKVITNDWMVNRMFRTLDPTKLWRFQVNFALDSSFPAANLFSFTVPWPLTGTIQTNLGGFPFRIGYVNTDMLSVELMKKPMETRLTFVIAVDDEGKNLYNDSGSWGQHLFWAGLKLSVSKPAQVHATVAIHRNYQAEFTLQPRYERAANHIK